MAAAVLAIYVRTLCPTVAGGDSGEFIVAAYTLGVAHPPGYPLYTLLGKLFTLLPLGTIAWRVNFFSAVCGAGAAALVFLAVTRWSRSAWAGLASASLFAFSPRVWPQAVTAEVFALNNLFAAGLIYLSVRFWEHRDVRLACGLFLWAGLGLSNHQTLIFYAIPAALFVLAYGGPEMRRPRRLGLFALCVLVGLLPYAYLPIASARVPLVSWGDQTTLQGFLTHFLRLEFGTFQLGVAGQDPGGLLLPRLGVYGSSTFADLLWIGPLLAAAGVILALRQRDRGLAWCWTAAFLFFVIVVNGLTNIPIDPGISRFIEGRFWQQPDLVICVFAGLGLTALAARIDPIARRRALPAAALAVAIAQPALHFREQDQTGSTQIRAGAKAILDSLPPRALVLEQGDQVFNGLRYMQMVEGYRTDVRVMDEMLLAYPWYDRLARKYFQDVSLPGHRLFPRHDNAGDYGMKAFLDANRERFPIYFVDVSMWADARAAYTLWPSGLVDRALLNPEEPALARWIDSARSSFSGVDATALGRYPEDSWERLSLMYYWRQVGKHAVGLAQWGAHHRDDRIALNRSAELMEAMLTQSPEAPKELHVELGVVYLELANYDPSLKGRARQELETFLQEAPVSDQEVPEVRQLLDETR